MNVFILLISFILTPLKAADSELLKPFLTDYCTSYPEGTRAQPELWKHCCEEHDLYFWGGGSLADRKAADLRLRSCVEATGAVTQARLMYTAVSIGGASPIRFKTKQWGHAFENRARYLSLSEAETTELSRHLELYNSDLDLALRQSFSDQLNSRLE